MDNVRKVLIIANDGKLTEALFRQVKKGDHFRFLEETGLVHYEALEDAHPNERGTYYEIQATQVVVEIVG